MKIALVNDDGYQAIGINILKDILESYNHDVYIIAPETEQSAKSMAITTSEKVTYKKIDDKTFIVNGTPSDCLLTLDRDIKELDIKDFDCVISGINIGGNLSTDILYSGTCNAARQAVLLGCKAIALSASTKCKDDHIYKGAASFVAENLEKLLSVLDLKSFLNINYPKNYDGKGHKITTIAKVDYKCLSSDKIERIIVENTKETDLEIDHSTVLDNFISISAIKVQPSISLEVEKKLVNLFMG